MTTSIRDSDRTPFQDIAALWPDPDATACMTNGTNGANGAGGDAATAIPRRIGDCRIRRVIASGGMATVYEAVQEAPRRIVAVKVMKRGIVSPSILRRFEYESQVLARLRHPNIAQIYEAGTHLEDGDAVPHFVMEYIPNARPITAYAREQKLDTRDTLAIFTQVCDAVHHGHLKGVIHRDLKPDNIMVDSVGAPRVIDFGVARAVDSDRTLTTLQTDVGQLVGTLPYMSPEQVEADPHDLDQRSDVYALGVVLYELIVGQLPYDVSRTPIYEATRIIREQAPVKPSTVDRRLKGDLETIVLTALSKAKSQRYQSARELGEDLRRYLRDEPIAAKRPTLRYVGRSYLGGAVRRHGIMSLVVVMLVAWAAARFAGEPLMYRWTSAHEAFRRVLTVLPRPAAKLDGFDTVRVVRMTDATFDEIDQLAAEHALTGVDASRWATVRRLHGRLMERLAAAGVKTVAFDIRFRGRQDVDEDFRRGVLALREKGVDVVVTARDWPDDERGGDQISPAFISDVRWGGTTVEFTDRGPWSVDLFMRRAGDSLVLPSLPLRTAAAFWRPGWEISVSPLEDQLELRYYRYTDPGGDPRARERVTRPTAVDVTSIEPYRGEAVLGLRPGDLVGFLACPPPPDDVLESASIDYEWVLRADDDALRRRLEGKIVMIGDCRVERHGGGGDYHPTPDGRRLAGVYGQATAVEWLLRNEVPIRAAWRVLPVLAILGAVGGILWRRFTIQLVALIVLLTGLAIWSVAAYSLSGQAYDPLGPSIAIITAWLMAVMVTRVRHNRLA